MTSGLHSLLLGNRDLVPVALWGLFSAPCLAEGIGIAGCGGSGRTESMGLCSNLHPLLPTMCITSAGKLPPI